MWLQQPKPHEAKIYFINHFPAGFGNVFGQEN